MNEFKKNTEAAKKAAEYSRKIDLEKIKNKRYKEEFETQCKENRDTTRSRNDLIRSDKLLESLDRERQKALNEMK